MRNLVIALLGLACPLVVGCAAGQGVGSPPARQCDAAGAQGQVGKVASALLGAELLQLTGARSLRWVPPESAVTMDYRPDRLTVSYDRDMKITEISCQ